VVSQECSTNNSPVLRNSPYLYGSNLILTLKKKRTYAGYKSLAQKVKTQVTGSLFVKRV
jgi:hypothetical protein